MFDLYILSSCPFCRKVTDFMDENNIKYHKFDTINNENALRLLEIGGKDQVPFLHNTQTGEKLYDSAAIIDYLKNFCE